MERNTKHHGLTYSLTLFSDEFLLRGGGGLLLLCYLDRMFELQVGARWSPARTVCFGLYVELFHFLPRRKKNKKQKSRTPLSSQNVYLRAVFAAQSHVQRCQQQSNLHKVSQ